MVGTRRGTRRRGLRLALALAAALALLLGVAPAAPAAFDFLTKWGSSGAGNGQFDVPLGIATDGGGNVYVADQGNNRIQKFTAAGAFLIKWGSPGTGNGQLTFPLGIATDGAGNLYVADTNNNRIQKFTAAGAFLIKWGSTPGAGNGQFFLPHAIATDTAGNVYVADTMNHRIQKFTPAGVFLGKWGSSGAADGQFETPSGIATDAAGNVYVADQANNRIQKFTPAGAFVSAWGWGVTNGGPALQVCTTTCQAGTAGAGDGQFDHPAAIATDGGGNVYVADRANHRIQKFTAAGAFLTKFGSFGVTDNGQFDFPQGIATDCRANVYVADTGNSRIQKFGETTPPSPPCASASPPDRTAPLITAAVAITRTFAVDTKGPAETPVTARKKAKRGTTFSYTLSEAARVVFTIEQKSKGRKVKGECKKQTRKNRKRPKCTRYRLAGRFAQQGTKGKNTKPFSGKIGSKTLKPGSYRATLLATDAAKNVSKPVTLSFKVVRG